MESRHDDTAIIVLMMFMLQLCSMDLGYMCNSTIMNILQILLNCEEQFICECF